MPGRVSEYEHGQRRVGTLYPFTRRVFPERRVYASAVQSTEDALVQSRVILEPKVYHEDRQKGG